MNYTLGLGAASVGLFVVLFSPFLGWVAVFLSGSDASGNALFGNSEVIAQISSISTRALCRDEFIGRWSWVK